MKIFAATVAFTMAKNVEDPFHVEDSFFTAPSTERRYKDLHAITLHYNPEFDHRKFWYYGCHCLMLSDRAMSTRGKGKPVDELDSLCKLYKECVHCAKMASSSQREPHRVHANVPCLSATKCTLLNWPNQTLWRLGPLIIMVTGPQPVSTIVMENPAKSVPVTLSQSAAVVMTNLTSCTIRLTQISNVVQMAPFRNNAQRTNNFPIEYF